MAAKKRKTKVFNKLLGIFFLVVAILALVSVARQLMETIALRKQKALVEEELATLRDENDSLTLTKTKLEDPNYVTTYARGEYMFSKSDEKVFYLPSGSSDSVAPIEKPEEKPAESEPEAGAVSEDPGKEE